METSEIEGERTNLLDLPNELVLMIAEEIESEDRRRFSKLCRHLFYMIRKQRNLERFHTLETMESVEIRERKGCKTDRYAPEFQAIVFRSYDDCPEVSSFIVHCSYKERDLKRDVQSFCSKHEIELSKVKYHETKNKQWSTTIDILKEAMAYYMVEKVVYYTEIEDFDMPFMVKLWNIHPCCSIVLQNKKYCIQPAHDQVYALLLGARLCSYGNPWAFSHNDCLEFCIEEERNEKMSQGDFRNRTRDLLQQLSFQIKMARERKVFDFYAKITFGGNSRDVYVKIKKMDNQPKEYFDFFEKKFVTTPVLE